MTLALDFPVRPEVAPLPALQRWLLGLFNLLVLIELGLGLALALDRLSMDVWIACHASVVVLLAMLWRCGRGASLRLMPVGFVAVFFAGPLGAAGHLLLTALLRFHTQQNDLLTQWHAKLAGAKQRDSYQVLFQSIASGRAIGCTTSPTRNFADLAVHGGVEEKQKMLGLIAVKYHPDFLPVLKLALRDREPVVRVQAAAAFSKLRLKFKSQLSQALQTPKVEPFGADHQKLVRDLQDCIDSGFLDGPELKQARQALSQCQSAASPPRARDA